MTTSILSIENASLIYDERIIFQNLTWSISVGTWVSLLGPSGCGKSSLLRLLASLPMTNAKASYHSSSFSPEQIAYMGQSDALFPWLTVLDNVMLQHTLNPTSHTHITKDYAIELLGRVGLSHALNSYPSELSGGMRQRAALARTLIQNKPIIMMDEPFSAVDAITRYTLQQLAAELLRDKTVILVTHDPNEALRLSHEIYVLSGQPGTMNNIMSMTTPTPRELTQHDLAGHATTLYHALSKASEVTV